MARLKQELRISNRGHRLPLPPIYKMTALARNSGVLRTRKRRFWENDSPSSWLGAPDRRRERKLLGAN